MRKRYLGDGVYAELDMGGVWITTSNGVETTNKIFLDSVVYNKLKQYVELPIAPAGVKGFDD